MLRCVEADRVFSVRGAPQAEPVGGGRLVALGRMWVSPEAEFDARAVRMSAEGRGLPAEAILKRYLPEVQPPPLSQSTPRVSKPIVLINH